MSKVLKNWGADVAMLDPKDVLFVRLDAPALPLRKLRRVLPSLLASRLPFPVESCVAIFDTGAGGAAAHVARCADLTAKLEAERGAGRDPRRIVPPAPLAWSLACAERRLAPGAPRAVFLDLGGRCALATGRGDSLEAVSVFGADEPESAWRFLAVAFGPEGAAGADILVAGARAEAIARALAARCKTVSVAAEPESFLERAAKRRDAVRALDLRAAAARQGVVPRHPGDGAVARRAVAAAAATALAAASFFCVAECLAAASAENDLAAARARQREAVNALAGYSVSARGEAAMREAAAAAEARRDPSLSRPDAVVAVAAVAKAAAQCGVTLSHVETHDGGVSASGSAPGSAAARDFAAALRMHGLRAAMTEAPIAEKSGRASFFVQPAGEDREKEALE